ncbi:Vacuolar protein-sorting-associated protein 33 [Entomophthora muscae]|uniref:Vacuolar protein-sorting-associated protein 33 n=1 Tax=Entomophthora muscae TaxID=34485 RepID=A0ACC2SPM8_9FUNG|nr:Vacuolar protein-sorting-associated protein 33 [Entomophthora muscae]
MLPLESFSLMSHLTHQYLDAAGQREDLRQHMVKILDSIRGKKVLVLDPTLSGPLSLVTEFSFLKERGVERVFFLGPDPVVTSDGESLLYLCRPTPVAMEQIADHMAGYEDKDSHLYLVPRRTLLAEKVLENRGVLGGFTAIGAFPMGAIPLEDDVYSLELTSAFNDLYLSGDVSCLHTIATTLTAFQEKQGGFSRILGKGDHAKLLSDMLQRTQMEKKEDPKPAAFEALVLLDRTSDLVTPLLTQLTYEGLLDEHLKVRHGLVEMPIEGGRRQKIAMNSADPILATLRDLNFAEVPGRLNAEARRISDDYNQRHAAQTVALIRDFVSRLGGLQAEHTHLKNHTVLAELLMSTTSTEEFTTRLELEQDLISGTTSAFSSPELVADMVDRQESLLSVLRLVCLQCQVHGGLPTKLYAQYQKDICQAYGYHHLTTLNSLEKSGLLTRQPDSGASSQRFNTVAKAFRLNVDEVDERQPNDISYVYSGYAPLSVRMVQCGIDVSTTSSRLNTAALSSTLEGFVAAINPLGSAPSPSGSLGPGWSKFEDVLRFIPGSTFDEVKSSQASVMKPQSEKVVIVVFLGGCTFTEIAALRYLSQSEQGARKYIVLTTGIISGETILSALSEKGHPGFLK